MAVAIEKWLNLHVGSRIGDRIVRSVAGRIGRDSTGELTCGKHYRQLQMNQAGNWSCPVSGCATRIETEVAG